MKGKKLLGIYTDDARDWDRNCDTFESLVNRTTGKHPMKVWLKFAKLNNYTSNAIKELIAEAQKAGAIQAI